MWKDVIAWDYEPATKRRPSPMLESAYCKNVRVEGVTLTNAPGWTMRLVASEPVYIRGSTDGIDLTVCRNVFVSDCDIATGDHAICIVPLSACVCCRASALPPLAFFRTLFHQS
jgi:polygalacturonase